MEHGSRTEVVPSEHFTRASCADGALSCDGVPLADLASAYGTPLHVFSEAALVASYRSIESALKAGAPNRAHHICYAMKANGAPAVLRRLVELGAGCDVVSGGELYWALQAGFAPEHVVMSGVGKRDDELTRAIEAGVTIHVESEPELDVIADIATSMKRDALLGLRINPNVDAKTHPYIATGLFDTKFGLSMKRAEDLLERIARQPNLKLTTMSSHIGSQIGDLPALQEATAITARLAVACRKLGAPITRIDVGGGWPVAYGDEDAVFPSFAALGAAIGRGLASADAPADMTLVIEPGRALVGDAGVLLTRVLFEKLQESHLGPGKGKRFVVVDAAMTELIRPALYQAYHAIETVSAPRGEATLANLVGPVCETGDFFAEDRPLAPTARGELVVLRTTGAYGSAMASEYNARPRAAEVMVRAGGAIEVMRPRGRVEDLHR
jgi:diaminopimelate decarboxylase